MIFNKILKSFFNKTNIFIRKLKFINKRKKLKNNNFSVFSSNCVGGCVLNDFGIRFNSPFVNLYLSAKDYIKYLERPQYYNSLELIFIESDEVYPIATLDDITIHFVHYKNTFDAYSSWQRRISRINYDNLFVIFSERDGCTFEDLKKFDALPYKNKVVFTHKAYPEIESSFYISGFENQDFLGDIISWKKPFCGIRGYDSFNFLDWFNEK